MVEALTIDQVVHQTGLTSRALRFYEARGLLRPLRTGGSSSVQVVVGCTAPNGQKTMLIIGDVKQGAFVQWAGVGYMPGGAVSADQPF